MLTGILKEAVIWVFEPKDLKDFTIVHIGCYNHLHILHYLL